jgi:hypothetical protein
MKKSLEARYSMASALPPMLNGPMTPARSLTRTLSPSVPLRARLCQLPLMMFVISLLSGRLSRSQNFVIK